MTESTLQIHYDGERPELLPFLPESAKTILDVGCGGGGFGRSVVHERPEVILWGVEPDVPSADNARSSGYTKVVTGTFPESVMTSDRFDAIFFNDVLEHMIDPAAALLAAHRLLEPSGVLVASIPNVRHVSVWWPLVRHGRWDYGDYGILDRTHLRFFTRATMDELFSGTGWQVNRITGINRSQRAGGPDGRKLRMLSTITRRASDAVLYVQYVVEASRR